MRGINVSGKNKIQMEALRRLLNEPNFKNIQTCVFTLLNWIARTKLTNTAIEKKLNVIATTRNLRTTLKLLALATI